MNSLLAPSQSFTVSKKPSALKAKIKADEQAMK